MPSPVRIVLMFGDGEDAPHINFNAGWKLVPDRGIPLHCRQDGHALRIGRDAIRKVDIPAFFAMVHAQNNAGLAWRVVVRRIKQQKTRPQLGHGNGMSVQNQIDPDIGGMTAVTARIHD